MKEEEMDRSIRDAARDAYNAPPEPPRDAMWTQIRAARQAQRGSGVNGAGALGDVVLTPPAQADPEVVPIHGRAWRWGWRALPIAALLILSFGLGRLSLLYERRTSAPVATTTLTSPRSSAPAARSAPRAAQPSTPTLAAARGDEGTPEAGGSDVARPRAAAGAPAPNSRAANGAIYRFAATQTLGQAELLLTSFRAETRARGSVDPQVAEWAGDVLSSTRLLLDSPAGRDPQLRALLEDVELVLAQIVQLRSAPTGAARGDADLIDHALQQRDLLPRLRTAVPAGAPVGT